MRYRKEFVSIWSILESCLWRKNLLISQSKLRTPGIFSRGAIVSDRDKIPGVPSKT